MGTHPNPAVLEKSLVDISLAKGMNEDDKEELVDWTKGLITVDNLVYHDSKALTLRPGIKSFGGSQIRRLANLDDGIGYLDLNGYFFQASEQAANVVSKGLFPEFSVQSKVAGVDPGGSTVASTGIVGCANLTNYTCIAYYISSGTSGAQLQIVIQDRLSGSIVKRYTYPAGSYTAPKFLMVPVDDRYLHFYFSSSNLKPQFFSIDTTSLPAGLNSPSLTALTGTANGDRLAGAVSITGSSVVCVSGTTLRLEKFSAAGSSTATGSDTGVTAVTGIDTDGTNFYVVGYLTGAPTRYKLKRINSSLTTTSTVTDTTAATASSVCLRVSVSPSGDCAIVAYDSTTLNSVVVPICTMFVCAVGATTFSLQTVQSMVCEGSLPFYNAEKQRHYVQQHNLTTNTSNSPDVVANSSVLVECSQIVSAVDYPVGQGGFAGTDQIRPVAVLDNYSAPLKATQNSRTLGYFQDNTTPPYKPHTDSNGKVLCVCGNLQAVSESAPVTYNALQLTVHDPTVSFAGNYASGGYGTSYDGTRWTEQGFLAAPSLFLATSGTGLTGVYNYLAVYSCTDFYGNTHYSRVSKISSITLANQGVSAIVSAPAFTQRDTNTINISLYRTSAGGTQYYLVERRLLSGSGGAPVVSTSFTVDNVADATVIGNPLLFRQPGTSGTALDRYHSNSSEHLCAHKDRMFYCRDKTVYYSSFKVDNEAFWYNPALSFNVPSGSGRLTGLASQDGVLVVFKRDAIHLVEGDGPAENGGNGSDYSTPRRINTEFGCIDCRSIVSTPLGTMYRSTRGIELLDRNFTVQPIGMPVYRTVNAFPNTGGSCFDRNNGTVLFALGNNLSTVSASKGTFDLGASNGIVICYDVVVGAWTTFTHSSLGSNGPIQDIVYAKAKASTASDSENVFMGAYGGLYYNSETSLFDLSSSFITWTVKTGWVKAPTTQDRLKVTDLYIAGIWKGNHQIKASYARNYNPTFTTVKQWPVEVVSAESAGLVQLNAQPPIEECQSMQFKIESVVTNNGGFPTSAGGQLDLFGLTVRLGLKGGGPKLPVAQKG